MGKYLIYWTNYDRYTVQLISQTKLNCVTNVQNEKMITKTNQMSRNSRIKPERPNFSVSKLRPHQLPSWTPIPDYSYQSIQFSYFPFPLFWLPLPPFERFPLPPLARCSFLCIPRMSFFRRLSTTLKAPLMPGGRLTFLPAPFLVTTYVTSLFSFPTPAFL